MKLEEPGQTNTIAQVTGYTSCINTRLLTDFSHGPHTNVPTKWHSAEHTGKNADRTTESGVRTYQDAL